MSKAQQVERWAVLAVRAKTVSQKSWISARVVGRERPWTRTFLVLQIGDLASSTKLPLEDVFPTEKQAKAEAKRRNAQDRKKAGAHST